MKSDRDFKLITGLIVTGGILACSVFLIYYNFEICKAPYVISIVFAIIPTIIAIIKFIKLYKDTTGNYKFLNCWIVILTILFFGCSFISFKVLNKVTNVSDYNSYEKVLKCDKYPNNKKIAHFPSSIPTEANNKEFKEWGSVGSDDSGMILTYSINKSEIESQEFKEKIENAKYKASSKTGLDEIGEKIYIPPVLYDILGLSSDFSVYILDASDMETTNSKISYSYGVMINNISNNITYYSVTCKK